IYSLGASLFFMLTGEEPEPINQQHPRRILAEISQAMDDIVAKATAIELKDRYLTAEELESELAREASVI
ncbi:MAG: hypothetical protein K2X81_16865, partial [Candidatus Obscuribacterales bacterium]|nr:hypothetical protein [Candidatus Obscuribacterales bacterium]